MTISFTVVEALATLRLAVNDGPILEGVVSDLAGRRPRIKVEEIAYERNLLTGAEELDVRGRPTTGRHRSGADLAAGALAQPSEEQRAEWLAEARQIAAGLTGERRETGGTTP